MSRPVNIVDILDSLTNLVGTVANSEAEKNNLRANRNHQKNMQDERLAAQERNNAFNRKFTALTNDNKELRNRINKSQVSLSEYNVAIDGLSKLSELDISAGGQGFTEEEINRHNNNLMSYSTDFTENMGDITKLAMAQEYNTKVLAALNNVEALAQEEVNKIGANIETLGNDAFDKVLDLSDYIARAENIGKEEAQLKASQLADEAVKNRETIIQGYEQNLYDKVVSGEMTEQEYDVKYAELVNNPKIAIDASIESSLKAIEDYYSPEGFGGTVIASQAPDMKESIDMLKDITSIEKITASSGQGLSDTIKDNLNAMDSDLRTMQTDIARVKKVNPKYLDKMGNVDLGMKYDANYFAENPQNISRLKRDVEKALKGISGWDTVFGGKVLDQKDMTTIEKAIKENNYELVVDMYKDNLDKIDLKYGKGLGDDGTIQHFEMLLNLWETTDSYETQLSGMGFDIQSPQNNVPTNTDNKDVNDTLKNIYKQYNFRNYKNTPK